MFSYSIRLMHTFTAVALYTFSKLQPLRTIFLFDCLWASLLSWHGQLSLSPSLPIPTDESISPARIRRDDLLKQLYVMFFLKDPPGKY